MLPTSNKNAQVVVATVYIDSKMFYIADQMVPKNSSGLNMELLANIRQCWPFVHSANAPMHEIVHLQVPTATVTGAVKLSSLKPNKKWVFKKQSKNHSDGNAANCSQHIGQHGMHESLSNSRWPTFAILSRLILSKLLILQLSPTNLNTANIVLLATLHLNRHQPEQISDLNSIFPMNLHNVCLHCLVESYKVIYGYCHLWKLPHYHVTLHDYLNWQVMWTALARTAKTASCSSFMNRNPAVVNGPSNFKNLPVAWFPQGAETVFIPFSDYYSAPLGLSSSINCKIPLPSEYKNVKNKNHHHLLKLALVCVDSAKFWAMVCNNATPQKMFAS
jgi:hypothetical protein